MAKAEKIFAFSNQVGGEITKLPNELQNPALYNGTRFTNDPETCSPAQAKAGATTGIYPCARLSVDFAKALARAAMLRDGVDCGAVGYCTSTGNSIAEFIVNDVYTENTQIPASIGEVIAVAYDSNSGLLLAEQGGKKVDVSKTGYAPFLMGLWGAFEKLEGFSEAFDKYLSKASNEEDIQKAACRMAAIAYEALQDGGNINLAAAPDNTNVRRLTDQQTLSERFAADEVVGTFKKFSVGASRQKRTPLTITSTQQFCGAFATDRELRAEEKELVPKLDDAYILPDEIVMAAKLISNTKKGIRPMTNIMLRGDPSVGKTAGARALAAGLGLPYVAFTCNAGTELYNLIGDMMPVDASAQNAQSVNAEMFKDFPSATDISMDPVTAYQQITGEEKADANEAECFAALFSAMMKTAGAAVQQGGFRYVESPLIRAVRYGWVCELQEPSLITRASVLPGLNGLMDETGYIVLPTGEILRRHPDTVIISTLNVDLEGCRPLNQSFIDRHHLIIDMEAPKDETIIKRIKGMTGCDDSIDLTTMVDTMHQIASVARSRGASDGNVNSMRALASWVEAVAITGEYRRSAEYTIVSCATADALTRKELSAVIANKFKV